ESKRQELVQLQAVAQGQEQELESKRQELVQLQAVAQGQEQELESKRQELVQLQAVAQGQEQELTTINDNIGWKLLNNYREKREKSTVFRYLHFLFTEPLKQS